MKWLAPLSRLRTLLRDERGASMMEFGLISPVVMIMLLGTLDAGHTLYVRSVVDGAMQKVARNSALEGGAVVAQQRFLDQTVRELVKTAVSTATVTTTRRYYKTFSSAAEARQETFTDTNGNMRCDAGEPYQDANNNLTWDRDGANDGQGGAKDVVIITVNVSYPRLFPMAGLIGMSNTVAISANTVLANQPYGEQDQYGAAVTRNCPL